MMKLLCNWVLDMGSYQDIEVSTLLEMMASQPILLVDVRNDDEVARGIIPSAIHIPLAMLPVEYEPLIDHETIVFYCHSGIRSAHAAAFASEKGCKQTFNLAGGVLAWAKAGQPFVNKDEKGTK